MDDPSFDQQYPHDESTSPTTAHEDLSTTFATAEIPPDMSTDSQVYNSSSSSSQHSDADNILDDGLEEDGLERIDSTASSRSSLSSLPGSVLVHPADDSRTFAASDFRTASTRHEQTDSEKCGGLTKHKIRDRTLPFRHPSSVRAMQMHTEDEDDEYITPPRRRGAAHRGSPSSVRSNGISPTKRNGYHTACGTPRNHSVKKEYPLVLLHCTLLPPKLVLSPGVNGPSRKLLEEVLPSRYWKRWKLLEEKISGSGVLRDRGVLISHPQEAYDVLEERLLESLELQRPRLRNGHFFGRDDANSGKEDQDADSEMDSESEHDGDECPDCGTRVIHNDETSRKWEIKIYAANGLMKAGAWAAAWREMEKVDVEVELWLPSSLRSDLERRILEEEFMTSGNAKDAAEELQGSSQDQIDGLEESLKADEREVPAVEVETPRRSSKSVMSTSHEKRAEEIDLRTLLVNYIWLLASDRRNVAIAFLGFLALFFAVSGGQQRPPSYFPDIVEFSDIPVVSPAVYSAASTSIQSATESPAAHVLAAPVEKSIDTSSVAPAAAATEKQQHAAPPSIPDTAATATGEEQHSAPTVNIAAPNVEESL